MTIKQHDTNVRFTYAPTVDGVRLTPEQLQDCSVSWILKRGDSTSTFKRAAIITAQAEFQYDATAEDVATAGHFYQEWELVDALGKILTFPNNGYYQVDIVADLG